MRCWVVSVFAAVLAVEGCTTVVEDKPLGGVEMNAFAVGAKRIDVLQKIGVPATSAKDGPNSCDIYRYAHTVNRAGQGAIDVAETAGNFFTFGLFGAVASPAEEAMKGKIHTVLFCYSGEERLVSVMDQGRSVTPGAGMQSAATKPAPLVAQSGALAAAAPAAQPVSLVVRSPSPPAALPPSSAIADASPAMKATPVAAEIPY